MRLGKSIRMKLGKLILNPPSLLFNKKAVNLQALVVISLYHIEQIAISG
mgnify:CR=1 FL=1|jgi:hypothetical protein